MVTNNVRSLSLILKFLYNEGQKETNTLLLSICDLESQKNPKVNVARHSLMKTKSKPNNNNKTKQSNKKNPSLVNLRNMSWQPSLTFCSFFIVSEVLRYLRVYAFWSTFSAQMVSEIFLGNMGVSFGSKTCKTSKILNNQVLKDLQNSVLREARNVTFLEH